MKLIVYLNATEALICREGDEKVMLKAYFKNGGRKKDEYDRYEKDGIVEIGSHLKVGGTGLGQSLHQDFAP